MAKTIRKTQKYFVLMASLCAFDSFFPPNCLFLVNLIPACIAQNPIFPGLSIKNDHSLHKSCNKCSECSCSTLIVPAQCYAVDSLQRMIKCP